MEYFQKDIKEGLESIAKRMDLEKISESLYFPKYFEVETIRACNAKCIMCTVHEWKDKNNRMEDRLFGKISEEMHHYKDWISRVCLSRNGEPLLDKNIAEKVKRLKDYGIKYLSFSTNASLLNEEKSIELIESGLDDIRFSIDGCTKETFESIRIGLNFEEIRNNCLNFIRLRNERGEKPYVHIRMALQKKNFHEEKIWNDYWLPRVSKDDVVSSKPIHSWGNQLDNYGKSKEEIEKYSSVPCISPWSTMVIHFDGQIPLCGCDYNNKILLGNLNDSSIKEAWNSKMFKKIRKMHSSGKRNQLSLCLGCNIWDPDIKRIYSR